ncbi:NAD+ synthase [Helicobacter pylori]
MEGKVKMEKLKNKMIDFLRTEVSQRGFERVVFGLSGGLDSAVVAYLCHEAFGANAKAILMPTSQSSKQHYKDALKIIRKLLLSYEVINLEKFENIFLSYKDMNSLRFGNLCARTRMMILYDIASRDKALVIGTSNKSERILGYGTIYGDLACAINPIGEIYKSDLYVFAKHLGIPNEIIQKKPSADLYKGQSDEKELGFSYEKIDGFLKKILKNNKDIYNLVLDSAIIDDEYSQEFIQSILERIQKNRFKLGVSKVFNP